MALPGRIGKYEVVSRIGQGGMGVVYSALDPDLGRHVAIKLISGFDAHSPRYDEALSRFRRESRAAAMLSHPNVVNVFDLGRIAESEGGAPYLVMELVDGDSLEHIIDAGNAPGPQDSLRIMKQVAEALDYAHSAGIVHRDVKPANIIVRRDGVVKLTDFGIARIVNDQVTRTGMMMGTPAYMSPEQIRGEHVDWRSDQFSFAVVAWLMLSEGTLPFEGPTDFSLMQQITTAEPPPLKARSGNYPSGVEQTLLRGLAKRPEERFPTCWDFFRTLEASLQGAMGPATATAPTTLESQSPRVTPFPPTARLGTVPPRVRLAETTAAPVPQMETTRPPSPSVPAVSPNRTGRAVFVGATAGIACMAAIWAGVHLTGSGAGKTQPPSVAVPKTTPQIVARVQAPPPGTKPVSEAAPYRPGPTPAPASSSEGAKAKVPPTNPDGRAKAESQGRVVPAAIEPKLIPPPVESFTPLNSAHPAVTETKTPQAPVFDANAAFSRGQQLFNAKDYSGALPLLHQSADAGNRDAMHLMGWFYHNGLGVAVDYHAAMDWYRRASELGNAASMSNLGVLYQNGWGTPVDYGAAMQWYRRAADGGFGMAMNNIGSLYENGLGVPQNRTEAMAWYQKAANLGVEAARQNLQRVSALPQPAATPPAVTSVAPGTAPSQQPAQTKKMKMPAAGLAPAQPVATPPTVASGIPGTAPSQQPVQTKKMKMPAARVTVVNVNGEVFLRFPTINYYSRVATILGQVGQSGSGNLSVSQNLVTFDGEGDGVYKHGHIGLSALRSRTTFKIEGGRQGDTFSLYFNGSRERFGEWKPDSALALLLRKAIEDFPSALAEAQ